MYKVFVYDKLIILSGTRVADIKYIKARQVEVYDRKSVKEAYTAFINAPDEQTVILYNKENEKRLLEDFISLFWYVEAAGGLVSNSNKDQLFIYRFSKWDLPKGKIEKNETRPQAAIREVREETGLMELAITRELPSTFHIFDHKGKKVLKRTYWFEMLYTGNSVPVPQEEEEITLVKWFSLSELHQVTDNTYASIRMMLSDIT